MSYFMIHTILFMIHTVQFLNYIYIYIYILGHEDGPVQKPKHVLGLTKDNNIR